MVCMPMLSPPSPTACGGIGAITPTVGGAILIMVMAGTAGIARVGASAGM